MIHTLITKCPKLHKHTISFFMEIYKTLEAWVVARGLAIWPGGLGNYFVCKRFAVQTFLRSLEFVFQINLEHDTAV